MKYARKLPRLFLDTTFVVVGSYSLLVGLHGVVVLFTFGSFGTSFMRQLAAAWLYPPDKLRKLFLELGPLSQYIESLKVQPPSIFVDLLLRLPNVVWSAVAFLDSSVFWMSIKALESFFYPTLFVALGSFILYKFLVRR